LDKTSSKVAVLEDYIVQHWLLRHHRPDDQSLIQSQVQQVKARLLFGLGGLAYLYLHAPLFASNKTWFLPLSAAYLLYNACSIWFIKRKPLSAPRTLSGPLFDSAVVACAMLIDGGHTSGMYIMMVIIGITSWPGYARYVRAEFLRLRQQDFVQAAVAAGLPLRSILFRHMLPNGVGPVLVAASFGVAAAILAEATLSFLGLGLVGEPSWGEMLNQAVQSSSFNWWMAVFPGGAIFLTVFAYNLIGEALRDAIDPYLGKAA